MLPACPPPVFWRVAALAIAACLLPVRLSYARPIRFEGFYEFRTDINLENASFAPNVEADGTSNRGAKNYFQGRIYADPAPGVNMYSKFELDSKSDDKYRYAEGHMFLKKSVNKKTLEWILFDSQERFNMGDPLLDVTGSQGDIRGMRMNGYAWGGWLHLYQGRFKNENADAFGFRIGKNFFAKNRLMLGATAVRKVWPTGYDDVVGTDVTVRFSEAELAIAGATSYTSNYAPGGRNIFQSELRNIRISNRRLGSLRMTSTFRDYFPGYRNYLGKDPEKRESGMYNELIYEVPLKALRLTYRDDRKRERRSYILINPERRTNWWYFGGYAEFQKGYRATLSHEGYNDPWNNNIDRPAWFAQIESYSRYNTLKCYFRRNDDGNRYQNDEFSVENSHTFSTNLFLMIRTIHRYTYESDLSQNSVFTQIRYRVRDNGNVLLEFGNNGSTTTDRILKTILQLWW